MSNLPIDAIVACDAEVERLRARVAELEADREWFTKEWQRLRATLNAIAWEPAVAVKAAEIARDTLAIGVESANERALKAARAANERGEG